MYAAATGLTQKEAERVSLGLAIFLSSSRGISERLAGFSIISLATRHPEMLQVCKTTTTNLALNFSHNSSEFHPVLGSDDNFLEYYDDEDNDEEDGGGWERSTV
ncbi:hypothetical protein ACE6H2_018803 [Prunus campanulata]